MPFSLQQFDRVYRIKLVKSKYLACDLSGYIWSSNEPCIFSHGPILLKGSKTGCQGRMLEKIGTCGEQADITLATDGLRRLQSPNIPLCQVTCGPAKNLACSVMVQSCSKAPRLDAKTVCLKRLEHMGFETTS
eukprot:15367083-Ditylum_brightwellii.AAC.1